MHSLDGSVSNYFRIAVTQAWANLICKLNSHLICEFTNIQDSIVSESRLTVQIKPWFGPITWQYCGSGQAIQVLWMPGVSSLSKINIHRCWQICFSRINHFCLGLFLPTGYGSTSPNHRYLQNTFEVFRKCYFSLIVLTGAIPDWYCGELKVLNTINLVLARLVLGKRQTQKLM